MTTIFDVPGTNPLNPFSSLIQALSSSATATDETAAHIVTTITTSSNPAHSLWQLWGALFTTVASSFDSNCRHFALLNSLQENSPTQPNNVPARSDAERMLRSYTNADGKLHWQSLPRFSAQWRDVHDILEAWRDWDGVRLSGGSLSGSGDKYYLHFCLFSAMLLKEAKGKGEIHPIQVFYSCHNVLERKDPQPREPKPHRMSTEQLWALDVRVAAIWMRDGGRALWETDRDELRRHWGLALDDKTKFWPGEDGLTRERWLLWGERLPALSTDEGKLDEETRVVLGEAAEVVDAILGETST